MAPKDFQSLLLQYAMQHTRSEVAAYPFADLQYPTDEHKTYRRPAKALPPFIAENLDPDRNVWVDREVNHAHRKPDLDRAVDYFHSTFVDLVLAHLLGLQPQAEGDPHLDHHSHETWASQLKGWFSKHEPAHRSLYGASRLLVNPLLDVDTVPYFAVDHLRYHGCEVAVVWDFDGTHYDYGRVDQPCHGLCVYVEGKIAASSLVMRRIVAPVVCR